jgi:inner membrane protein
MDSLTHIALGVCTGQLIAGKKLGRKAWIGGAAFQSFPDIDFIAGTWLSPAEDLLAHRGFTHSLLFAILFSFFVALLFSNLPILKKYKFKDWLFFCGIELLIHVLLDTMNVYGTGWLEPFSHRRLAFNVLFVADPFFTFPLLLSCVFLVSGVIQVKRRRFVAIVAVTSSVLYLMYAGYNKWTIDSLVRNELTKQTNSFRYFTTPTPFNSWLWYIVAADKNGFKIGYRSVFDNTQSISLLTLPQQSNWLPVAMNQEAVPHLIRFSKGYYAIQKVGDTVLFNDLRFGRMIGCEDSLYSFVFHYSLQPDADNGLVIQRGRFQGWTRKGWLLYLRRIFTSDETN